MRTLDIYVCPDYPKKEIVLLFYQKDNNQSFCPAFKKRLNSLSQ